MHAKQILVFCIALSVTLPVSSHSAQQDRHKPSVLSVCQVASLDEPYPSQVVTIKAFTIITEDSYGFYLADDRCFHKTVAVKFPVSYSSESGIGSLVDLSRPNRVDPS